MKEYEKSPQHKDSRHSSIEKPKVSNEPSRTQAEVSLNYNSQKSANWRERYKNIGNKQSSQQVEQAAPAAAPKEDFNGGTTVAQASVTVPIPASIKDNPEEIWIQYYLQQNPGASRNDAKAWLNSGVSGTQIKPGEALLRLRGPYKDGRGEYFVIVEEYIYDPKSAPRVGDIPPLATSPEFVPSKPQTDLLSPAAPTPENRPQGAPVKIEEWIPFTVEVDQENPFGLILIPPASSRDLPIKLPTRVWDNQKYEIVRVVRYKTGLQDEYIKGREIYLLPRDIVKIPLFSFGNAAPSPLQPQPGTHKVDNTETLKQQLSQLPGEVKYLLGGEQSFQPENHQRLLKIGTQIQQLSPEQFRYYKPIANQFVGNLDSLERSIDVFTRTRDIVSQQLQVEQTNDIAAQINNQLFVIQSVITNSVWQQFLKDLIASIVESPKYVGDELQQLFEILKDHWGQFIALIAAFALAEGLVLFLTGLPEPTFLSKVIAVAIQGILYTIYGIDIVVSVASTVNELMNWWNAVSSANGDPKKIEQASRAFLRMIGNLILLFLSSKDFQKKLSAENREKLLAMLRRQSQPSTSSLPGEKPPSVMDLTYDPETKSYVVKNKPNSDAPPKDSSALEPSKPIYLKATRIMFNELGEEHEFKLFSDGTILRCSAECADIARHFGKRLRLFLRDPALKEQAESLSKRTQELFQSRATTTNQQALLDEAVQIEMEISKLEAKFKPKQMAFLARTSPLAPKKGRIEQQESLRSLIDTSELLKYDPLLQNQYSAKLAELDAEWIKISELAQKTPSANLKTEFTVLREELQDLKNTLRPQLLEPRLQELSDVETELLPKLSKKRTDTTELTKTLKLLQQLQFSPIEPQKKRQLLQNAQATVQELQSKLKQLEVEIQPLREKLQQIEQEIKDIEQFIDNAKESTIIERFADDVKAVDVLQRLTSDKTTSSFKPFAEMLQREGIIQNLNEIVPIIESTKPQGKRVDAVRDTLKRHYRQAIMERITNPDTNVMQLRYPDLPWGNDPSEAYNMARYQEMIRFVEALNSADKGSIAENWYELVYSKKRGSTQVPISQSEISKQGVNISQDRRVDEVYGDTIREQKTISGALKDNKERSELQQFNDYMELVSKPGGSEISVGKNKKYIVKRLMYSFIDPRGVRANADWMYEQLRNYKNLDFEIFNSKGERKIINQVNRNELRNPTLSNWLGLP